MQKPSKTRKERMTARLLLRRDKNDDGKEGKGGKEEVDYEGIRDMFQTPVRSTVVVCDGVVVNPGSGREEGEGVRDGGYGDCDGDGAGLEEGMLGKDDEARVGMLLRRIRLGGPGGRKKTGRVGG